MIELSEFKYNKIELGIKLNLFNERLKLSKNLKELSKIFYKKSC